METPEDIQNFLFRRIKELIPASHSLVDQVAELLGVSNDSAYRRIRGETSLSLKETAILLKHFQIPAEVLLGNGDNSSVIFNYKVSHGLDADFDQYLQGILNDLRNIAKAENREIIYAAKDIPIFHHFLFPELAAFKIFFWMKSVMNVPSYSKKMFNREEIDKTFFERGKEILALYEKIPATEIWSEETLNSTVKQIEYCWDSGFFKTKEDALFLCEQLNSMMQHIQKQAELGMKFHPAHTPMHQEEGNYQLYYNEMLIGNNNILVTAGGSQITYLTHNVLNYLITSNAAFCKETEESLKSLIKKSVLISGVSEKQRNQFFRKALGLIEQLAEKIRK